MNTSRFLQQIMRVLVVVFLAGCVPSTAMPIPSPTQPPTPVPPTAIPTPLPTPTASLLLPGDQIGEMSIGVSSGLVPNWLDYCMPAFSNQPGGETLDCKIPAFPELTIGAFWGARDDTTLDSSWEALTWELEVDGQPVNLDAFGTFDFAWVFEGTPVKVRAWDVKLVNAPPGEHTLRYRYTVNEAVDDGFSVTQPGTYESVVNLRLLSPEELPTTTPVPTPPPVEPAWWHDSVFYEVFVRSFADSTTGPLANDGIGDLQGLIEKLDYLNDGDPATTDDLGVTGLWLMPIMASPSYHGYDVTDYYTVNPEYGSNEDLKRLVAEAHHRGIQVIIDLPINHTSSEHPWFIEARDDPDSERRDWYLWSQDKPDYLGPWGQEVWHPSPSGYYYGLFWSGMPDLNLENPQVTTEMENLARFWLEDMDVDGFRLDAARHLIEEGSLQENTAATHKWWENFRGVYKAANPEALAVGEIWTNNAAVATYLEGDELDLAFDFDLAAAMINGVNIFDAARIQRALTASYSLFGSGLSGTFLTNHDMNRAKSQLSGDVNKAKLAAALLLTTPGVPFVYYGEEIGMTGEKPDEMIRTPMQWSGEANAGFTPGTPWEPVNADYPEKNVALQLEDPASLLSFYRELIQIRSNHPALRLGGYYPVNSGDSEILAFLRSSDDENLLVMINLGEGAASEPVLTLNEGPLAGTYQASLLYGGEADLPNLVANDKGGFDAYQPLAEIPGNGMIIIDLLPVQ